MWGHKAKTGRDNWISEDGPTYNCTWFHEHVWIPPKNLGSKKKKKRESGGLRTTWAESNRYYGDPRLISRPQLVAETDGDWSGNRDAWSTADAIDKTGTGQGTRIDAAEVATTNDGLDVTHDAESPREHGLATPAISIPIPTVGGKKKQPNKTITYDSAELVGWGLDIEYSSTPS